MVLYVTCWYRITPGLQSANISYLMQLKLFFKIGYVCIYPKGVKWNRTVIAVLILCDYSTGCDEMGNFCHRSRLKDRH